MDQVLELIKKQPETVKSNQVIEIPNSESTAKASHCQGGGDGNW